MSFAVRSKNGEGDPRCANVINKSTLFIFTTLKITLHKNEGVLY